MSILLTTENGWVISHLRYLDELYTNVNYNSIKCDLKFNKDIFNVNSPYLRMNQICLSTIGVLSKANCKKSRKKKKINPFLSISMQQTQFVERELHKITICALEKGYYSDPVFIDHNEQALRASQQFHSEVIEDIPEQFNGANQSNNPIITKIGSNDYVIPENCAFYSYDIRNIHQKIQLNNQFDFILMDPPWWNKFIRRNKTFGYKMMHYDDLCKIPINRLLSTCGIIAIWCTNASSHFYNLTEVMFPAWGIKFIAKWYWVKVTQSGSVVCNFDYGTGKQPYELLIFGSFSSNQTSKIPDNKLIVSVPSAIHSHKPPITEVIKPYLMENPYCLEIFARYLLPGWTSWGLEILKFQRLSLYNICKLTDENNEIETK